MKKVSNFLSSVAVVGLIMSGSVAMAEEEQPEATVEVDPRIAEANARKAASEAETAANNAAKTAAEARSAQIAAEREAFLARFPETETTGAEGTATATGGGYYATFLSHQAMAEAADQIATDIKEATRDGDYEIFLVNGIDLPPAIAQWRQINGQVTNLQTAIDALLASLPDGSQELSFEQNEAVGALSLLSAAPQILGGVADIAAFFRSNITTEGLTVNLKEEELAALIIDKLPATVPVRYPNLSLLGETELIEKLTTLRKSDAELRKKKEGIVLAGQQTLAAEKAKLAPVNAKIARLDEQLKDEKDPEKRAELEQKKAIQNSIKVGREERINFLEALTAEQGAAIDALREDVSSVITALNTANEAGITPLQATDPIAIIVAAENAALLHVNVASTGGERQIKTGAFGSGRVSYLGGVGVSFRLTDRNGRVLATGSQSLMQQESMRRGDFFKRNALVESGE